MKLKKILAPVDFSPYSEKALEYALLWANKFGGNITLLHVNTLFHKHADRVTFESEYRHITDAQKKHVQKWMKEHKVKVSEGKLDFELLNGASAANEILNYLAKKDFDLVVMGTHGRTGPRHFFLGSVAERVSRLSPVPVMTVHHSTQKLDIANILVPIDFSDYTRPVIDQAMALAQAFDATVHLLHVHEHPDSGVLNWLSAEAAESLHHAEENIREQMTERLKSYIENFRNAKVRLETVNAPHAYSEIIRYAKNYDIDLIVMVTRGFNKFEYFWSFGSNTERVVRLASGAVLAVRENILKEMSEREKILL